MKRVEGKAVIVEPRVGLASLSNRPLRGFRRCPAGNFPRYNYVVSCRDILRG